MPLRFRSIKDIKTKKHLEYMEQVDKKDNGILLTVPKIAMSLDVSIATFLSYAKRTQPNASEAVSTYMEGLLTRCSSVIEDYAYGTANYKGDPKLLSLIMKSHLGYTERQEVHVTGKLDYETRVSKNASRIADDYASEFCREQGIEIIKGEKEEEEEQE